VCYDQFEQGLSNFSWKGPGKALRAAVISAVVGWRQHRQHRMSITMFHNTPCKEKCRLDRAHGCGLLALDLKDSHFSHLLLFGLLLAQNLSVTTEHSEIRLASFNLTIANS
jgi:hypothetical protein